MKHPYTIVVYVALVFMPNLYLVAQANKSQVSLAYAVDTLSFHSNAALTEKLKYENKILYHKNYKKSFLPALSFDLTPVIYACFNKLLTAIIHT